MSNFPPSINFHITLITPEDIAEPIVKNWNKIVRENAPYGVPCSITITDDKGNPQNVNLVKREANNGFHFMVPLSRDLTEKEAEKIINTFDEKYPELEFEVEASIIPTYAMKNSEPTITVNQKEYADVATDFAKQEHENWVKSRMEQGWRYGTSVDLANKTHPLLKPWDQLPDQYKQVDYDNPQKLLDLLSKHGYVVVAKDDLEAVMRVIRKVQ